MRAALVARSVFSESRVRGHRRRERTGPQKERTSSRSSVSKCQWRSLNSLAGFLKKLGQRLTDWSRWTDPHDENANAVEAAKRKTSENKRLWRRPLASRRISSQSVIDGEGSKNDSLPNAKKGTRAAEDTEDARAEAEKTEET